MRACAWDWKGAEELYRQALEIDPVNETILVNYSFFLAKVGRPDEAFSRCNQALELCPDSTWVKSYHMRLLYYTREFDKAIEVGRELLGQPGFLHITLLVMGLINMMKGMLGEALEALGKARELLREEHTSPSVFVDLVEAYYGFALAKAGRQDDAQVVLADLMDKSKRVYVTPYVISLIHLGLGDIDSHFEWAQRAYEENDEFLGYININPVLDETRSDPRHTALAEKMGLSG